MSASLRLLRIEVRRSPGLFLFVPIAAVVWLIVKLISVGEIVLWPEITTTARDSAGIIGPAVAGLAAWIAGRGQRGRTAELLDTTPRPATVRELAAWAAIAGWGVIGWAVGAGVVLAQASMEATWGMPVAFPLIIALLVIVASASWGYAAGAWASSRFTAPLSAVVVFLFLFLPGAFSYPLQNLSPFSLSYDSVFWRVRPDLSAWHVALLLSLTVLGLASAALRYHKSPAAWATALGTAVASLVLLVILMGAERQTGVSRIPYEPLCAQGGIEVCIHPAFEAAQTETVDVIERLTQPLLGVPGAPVKAEQGPRSDQWGLSSAGVLHFQLLETETFVGGGDTLASRVAGALVFGHACCGEAQEVIRGWLLRQAGISAEVCEATDGGGVCAGIPRRFVAEIERFAALEPEVRDAWLHDNYAALTRGELTLEDLP
jgi:hypothetical protein